MSRICTGDLEEGGYRVHDPDRLEGDVNELPAEVLGEIKGAVERCRDLEDYTL